MATTKTQPGLYFEDGGNGRPVVLIHGWPLEGSAWDPNIEAVREAGFRVIAYDRRGFGDSDKPESGYTYDDLSDDLARLLDELDLDDVTLVGFSMGGGEVARYISRHGEDRIRSVVFAAAVPPFMMKTDDNPDGPLTKEAAAQMTKAVKADRAKFFDEFTTNFFTADGELMVSEAVRQQAIDMCLKSGETATLECMKSFGETDFRDDLKAITVPTLIIHGDSDGIVPVEGSGHRTDEAVPHGEIHLIESGPHGINASHADEFNEKLIKFLRSDDVGS